MTLHLYGTSACHLCEQALVILEEASTQLPFSWIEIDIAENEELMQSYGVKIPVLQANTGAELCWPFCKNDVITFLSAQL